MSNNIKNKILPFVLSGVLSSFFCLGASAETIQFPVGDQGVNKNINMPSAGMSMNDVSRRYGNAQRVFNPVGDPPISKWQFAQYTVYFEGDRVLHSVIHR